MGKGGGGRVDTSGLERATREATNLQKDIYGQNVELAQPFYDVGVGATGRLADLLGIGGGSMRSREQVYQDLLPQYTSQQGSDAGLVNIGGFTAGLNQLIDPEVTGESIFGNQLQGLTNVQREQVLNQRQNLLNAYNQTGDINAALEAGSATALGPIGQDVTDFEALNAAVDEALAGQELPDDYGSLTERFGLSKFEEDPGYQYRQQEGQKALERAMAAQGVTLGGGGFGNVNPQVAKALMEQSQGIASQEYGNAYNRYVNDQLNQFNMLAQMGGFGTTGLGAITGAGNQMATNVGNLTTGLAQAQTQADIAAASQPSMFEQLLPVAGQIGGAYILSSDIRLKENVKYVGDENGHKLYEFSYKGKPERYVGVMAQEVKEIVPEAVSEIDGYLAVNYGMIGLEMRQV